MPSTAYIFLAGASRGVGREIAHCLIAQSLNVKALVRSTAVQAELEAMGIKVALGDALDTEAVEQAMLADPISAVISTIGGLRADGQRVDFLGNKALIDAAVQAKAQKFVLVSSIGSGNTAAALQPQVLEALHDALVAKEQAEQHLIASGLTYTIVRPGGLKSEPATGNAVLTSDPTIAGSINRADVATLVCQCLLSDKANNQTLSAVDRQMVYVQKEFEILDLSS
ncbi:MAG: SDR family oxidoreductase [Drouetiella hepatica Uher 2000/2452]|uniref:SDR family oxidoreductase n=1 Tax=Drouetiella hepatica Uher 2000/2452 TaxID=904376 RepID=A0A951QBQ3_9CYAN|nr:SDR family oxidoreductase [Drouetiella hepatica Uher 2000/2452]